MRNSEKKPQTSKSSCVEQLIEDLDCVPRMYTRPANEHHSSFSMIVELWSGWPMARARPREMFPGLIVLTWTGYLIGLTLASKSIMQYQQTHRWHPYHRFVLSREAVSVDTTIPFDDTTYVPWQPFFQQCKTTTSSRSSLIKRHSLTEAFAQSFIQAVWCIFMNHCIWAMLHLCSDGEELPWKITRYASFRPSSKRCRHNWICWYTVNHKYLDWIWYLSGFLTAVGEIFPQIGEQVRKLMNTEVCVFSDSVCLS